MAFRGRIFEIIRFGVVGVAATVVHFGMLSLGVELLGIIPAVANGLAFLCAVGVTYFGQSLWVFRDHGGRSSTQLLRFAASLALGFLANMAVMAVATQGLGLSYRIGFLIGCFLVPMLSYVVNRFWVFRSHPA